VSEIFKFVEVREIKNQILITVHYLVEAEKDDFWDSGYYYQVNKTAKKQLNEISLISYNKYQEANKNSFISLWVNDPTTLKGRGL